jgi:hypothetical protein
MKIKKGTRPTREDAPRLLPARFDPVWEVIMKCWSGDIGKRMQLADIDSELARVQQEAET